jgi:hypothetical protein
MIPEFKKKEIIVEKDSKEVKLGSGDTKETVGIIKYIGKKVDNYEVGDKILFDLSVARLEIKYFGKILLRIENEDFVICKIIENE